MKGADDTSAIGWPFFAWWLLGFLGFPLGGLLAFTVAGSVEGVVTGAIAGTLAGAVIGLAQWLVLRRYLGLGMWWIPATSAGLATGNAAGALLTSAGTGVGDLIVTGLTAGGVVGLAQWALLRPHVHTAILWMPAVAMAWPLGWTVTWSAGVDVERGYAVFGATGALVFAAITGAVLWSLLRLPNSAPLPGSTAP